jgi:holo-[acyl-carrier protein] synthase
MEDMILGTGIDIIEIDRIQKAVERWGDAFLNHVFTPEEIENARKFKSPYPHYAGRFAAKEAIFKAMGIPQLSWHSVSIINDRDGKPVCRYNDKLLDAGIKDRLLISISHGRDYAVASAIVEG